MLCFPEFPELHRIVMRFARTLNSFLHTDDYLEHKDMFPVLDKISNAIWDVFAHGVRINYHNTHYADQVDKWVKMYKDEVAELDAVMDAEQNKIEQISTRTTKLAPHVINIKHHPEKHNFEKLDIDHIVN